MESWVTAYLKSVLSAKKYQEPDHLYISTDVLSKHVPASMFQRTLTLFRTDKLEGSSARQSEDGRGPDPVPAQDALVVKPIRTRLPALEALRKYAKEHVILRGRPGSGKTTTLRQLLLEEAAQLLSEISSSRAVPPSGKIPIFVHLKYLEADPVDLIGRALAKYGISRDEDEINKSLQSGQFFLLLDGLNEIPSGQTGIKSLQALRDRYGAWTPMIFSTRETLGGSGLTLRNQLKMEPLSKKQIKEFAGTYLSKVQAAAMLRALEPRMKELAETPMFLTMLCGLFASNEKLPSSMAQVVKLWTEDVYWPIKLYAHPGAAEKPNWDKLVQSLAWEMNLEGKTFLPFEKSKQVVESSLAELSKTHAPADVESYLNRLLDFHLIQPGKDKSMEFPHQLIQEYYAAIRLSSLLEREVISDENLKRNYLNEHKWTETVAIMLSLLEDKEQAVRVVKAAFEVDLVLGARLAGKAAPNFQQATVGLLNQLPVPLRNKIFLLGETKSEEAVQHVIPWLSHEDEYFRYEVIKVLAKIGSEKAVDPLIKLLENEESWGRGYAAYVLGQIGSDNAVNDLIKQLSHGNSKVRSDAALALGEGGIDKAVDELVKLLGDRDPIVRSAANTALGWIGSDKAVDELIKLLNNQDSEIRIAAALGLGEAGADKAVDELIQLLSDDHALLRGAAALGLGKIGGDKAVGELIKLLKDHDSSVRTDAAVVLGEIAGDKALDELIKLLNDQDSEVREAAACAVGENGGDNVVDELIQMLSDENVELRMAAAEALGWSGSDKAVNELIKLLGDQDPGVRGNAAFALGKLNNLNALDELIKRLNDKARSVRWAAARALGEIGSATAVEELIKHLNDADPEVRRSVAEASGQIGSDKAVDELIKLLDDEDSKVRQAAVHSLGQIGSDKAVDELVNRINDKNSDIYWAAAVGLSRIVVRTSRAQMRDTLINMDNPHILVTMGAAQADLGYYNHDLQMERQACAVTVRSEAVIILHLSDLHFRNADDVDPWLFSLIGDLKKELNCSRLDALVLSGDVSSKSKKEGYVAAVKFTRDLVNAFHLSPEGLVIVPGNHDVSREDCSPEMSRFSRFSECFWNNIFGETYPTEYENQFTITPLLDHQVVIVGFNSACQIDYATINRTAWAKALDIVRKEYGDWMKIVTWHHPLKSEEESSGLMDTLIDEGFRILLHGHIHKDEPRVVSHGRGKAAKIMWVIPAGSFGTEGKRLASGYPWQYNLIRIEGNKVKIFSRTRQKPLSPWKPAYDESPLKGEPPREYWEIDLK